MWRGSLGLLRGFWGGWGGRGVVELDLFIWVAVIGPWPKSCIDLKASLFLNCGFFRRGILLFFSFATFFLISSSSAESVYEYLKSLS